MSKKSRILALALVGVLGLVWVFWATVGNNSGVDNKLISYQVVDPTLTTVDVAVTKDPSATARCALQAMNDSYAVVGFKVITIGPNGNGSGTDSGRTTTVRGALRTDAPAVTGLVQECWIVH